MKAHEMYVTLKGEEIPLNGLDPEERRLLARLRRRAASGSGWTEYGNFWMAEVARFYDERGLSRSESKRTAVYRVAQDLCSRLGIAAGLVREPEYRAELEELIRREFPTRRAFCQATGLSETMLSHVLAGRKDMSLTALSQGLDRIGYRLRIVPADASKTR